MIADHARKDSPPGSVSWKLIEDSVKKGTLLDKHEYVIGSLGGQSRPAGSSRRGKGTRTPFSQQDDQILLKWVACIVEIGHQQRGKLGYECLEHKVGRPPAQLVHG